MIRLIAIIITAVMFPVEATSALQDDRAAKILNDFSSRIDAAPSVKLDFTFIVSSLRDDAQEEFTGTIVMKGSKYRLETMEMVSWFDGTSVYTLMPDVKELIISDPDEDGGIMANPVNLFSIYDEEFRYRFIGEARQSGKVLYEIDLHPLDLDRDFHTVKLFIDKESLFLYSAVIAAKDGTRYTFLVNDYDTRKQLPEDFFTYSKEKYQDVEIIDMRW